MAELEQVYEPWHSEPITEYSPDVLYHRQSYQYQQRASYRSFNSDGQPVADAEPTSSDELDGRLDVAATTVLSLQQVVRFCSLQKSSAGGSMVRTARRRRRRVNDDVCVPSQCGASQPPPRRSQLAKERITGPLGHRMTSRPSWLT
ncbi:hypothetical protein CBL_07620 [Carabus blaptoides fortunei]